MLLDEARHGRGESSGWKKQGCTGLKRCLCGFAPLRLGVKLLEKSCPPGRVYGRGSPHLFQRNGENCYQETIKQLDTTTNDTARRRGCPRKSPAMCLWGGNVDVCHRGLPPPSTTAGQPAGSARPHPDGSHPGCWGRRNAKPGAWFLMRTAPANCSNRMGRIDRMKSRLGRFHPGIVLAFQNGPTNLNIFFNPVSCTACAGHSLHSCLFCAR